MLQRMSGTASADIRTGAERTLELLEAQVGRSLDEVETPAAVVDLDRLEANLQRLQSYADSHTIALWPHTMFPDGLLNDGYFAAPSEAAQATATATVEARTRLKRRGYMVSS